MFKNRNFVLTASALATAFCLTATLAAHATGIANIAISSPTTKVSKSFVEREIMRQARVQGVSLTPGEARSAASRAVDGLASKGPGPQKLIIHLKFKRFTICISTGPDKGYCKGGKS